MANNGIRLIPKEDINAEKFMPISVDRAQRLCKSVVVDYHTEKRAAFTVSDKEKNTVHSVIFSKEKKAPADWNCDCIWHSSKGMNGVYCAHILAVNLFLSEAPRKVL